MTGDVVRYRLHQPMGIVEVLDGCRVCFEPQAEGFGLFDAGGELLSWWPIFPAPGHNDLSLPAGWGFQARRIIDVVGGRALLGVFAG